jgi:hypothetical protein
MSKGVHAPGSRADSFSGGTLTADPPGGRAVDDVLAEAHSTKSHGPGLGDMIRFLVVSTYLSLVFVWLTATRKIRPGISIRRIVRRWLFRVKHPRPLTAIEPETGHCFVARVNPRIASDAESLSRVQVFENDTPLPSPHAGHDDIRERGRGRFSHWNGAIYFASTDNTDPRTNGRHYTFKEV